MKQSYILSDHDRRCLIDALCCVSAADSRISRGEFSILINALKAAGLQDSDPELKAIVETRCREIHKAGVQRSTEATIAAMRASRKPELGVLICRLQASMLAVDGRVTEYESAVANLFRDAFHGEDIACNAANQRPKYDSRKSKTYHLVDDITTIKSAIISDAEWLVGLVATQIRPPVEGRRNETYRLCGTLATALTAMALFVPNFVDTSNGEVDIAVRIGMVIAVLMCIITGLLLAVWASARFVLMAAVALLFSLRWTPIVGQSGALFKV